MADSERHRSVSRRGVLRGIGGALAAATAGVGLSQSSAAAGEPVALQYFHEHWQTITNDLERVGSLGFDAIWIQQPAESMLDWADQSGRNDPPLGYQPIDFTNFDSSFGTESELKTLIDTAHSNGVDVIVDTVMNHTANTNDYSILPQFDQSHFHNNGEIPQWAYSFDPNNPDCYENGDTSGTPKDPYEYECDPYLVENAALLGLNDLDQGQQYVRDVLKNYVDKIASLGADGYRFDAAKHMPESFFANYANQWAEDNGMFRVGEVYDGNPRYLRGYANAGPGMHVFDFSLYYAMKRAFDGGDMSQLEGAGLIATDPLKAMPFVENHDVAAPSQYELAHAFMLSSEGYPMLYNLYPDELLTNDNIMNAVWVKRNLAGGRTNWLTTDSDIAVYERVGNLLVGLNNGSSDRTVTVTTSWSDQELRDYMDRQPNVTTAGDGTVQITIPAGSWVFYAEPGQGDPTDGMEGTTDQITLKIDAPVAEGESVYFTGSISSLTNWGTGIEGTQSNGVWQVTIDDPGTTFEWKTRRGPAGGSGDVWESGDNHTSYSPTHNGWEDGFEGSESPPTAAFSYTPSAPTVDEQVTFDAAESSDPDGDIQSYAWDFTGDGTTDATGTQVTHTFGNQGSYDVTLTVADGSDSTADDSTTSTVQVESATGVVDQYNTDGDGCVDVSELNTGVDDYFTDDISINQLNTLIDEYFKCL